MAKLLPPDGLLLHWYFKVPGLQMGDQGVLVRCYVDDHLLLDFLQHQAAVPNGALVLIVSEKHSDRFPMVCGVYQCLHKSHVWSPSDSLLKHADSTLVLAYLDFLLAGKANAFYGNMFSSFSIELVAEFQDHSRKSSYYNPVLESVP